MIEPYAALQSVLLERIKTPIEAKKTFRILQELTEQFFSFSPPVDPKDLKKLNLRFVDIVRPLDRTIQNSLGASLIPLENSPGYFAIGQCPTDFTRETFGTALSSFNIHTIVDLIHENEYGRENDYGNVSPYLSVRPLEKGEQFIIEKRNIKDVKGEGACDVVYIRYPFWKDHYDTEKMVFFDLVLKIYQEAQESLAGIFVHCRAGVGRSGTTAAALFYLDWFQKQEELKKNSLDELKMKMCAIIVNLRYYNGPYTVQKPAQLNLLFAFIEWLHSDEGRELLRK